MRWETDEVQTCWSGQEELATLPALPLPWLQGGGAHHICLQPALMGPESVLSGVSSESGCSLSHRAQVARAGGDRAALGPRPFLLISQGHVLYCGVFGKTRQ